MEHRTLRIFPLAYHVILQAYGRWLPGDPRGWHRRGDGAMAPPRAGNAALYAISRELQSHPPATITDAIRESINEAILSIALERGWTIHEIAMTDSHFHAVATAQVRGVEILRVIREETHTFLARRGLIEPSRPFWSAGGYFSMIHTASGLERTCRYVARHLAPLAGETVIDDVSDHAPRG